MQKKYIGDEIGYFEIMLIKTIAVNRYDKAIFDYYYKEISSLQDLAAKLGIEANNINLVLGDDWFIMYEDIDGIVTFIEWIALEIKGRKLSQAVEMSNALNIILEQNKDKEFIASMRHDTSYQFYQKLLQKKYIIELFHSLSIDWAEPNNLSLDDCEEIVKYFPNNENLYDAEFLKFVFHNINFKVNTQEYKFNRKRIYLKN